MSTERSEDEEFELKLIFLRELGTGYAAARSAHEKLANDPSDAAAARELREFFRRVADTAEAVDLLLLARLAAVCEQAADALIESAIPPSRRVVRLLAEGMAGAAAVLEGRARNGEEPGRPRTDGRLAAQVLIVDSDPVNVRLATDILQSAGFSCAACDPDRALEAVAMHPPDLLLVETLDLTRRLRSHPSLQLTPILMAARAGPELRARALQAGVSDLVARPFEAQDLVSSVRWYTQKLLDLREMHIRDGLTRAYNSEYLKLRLEEEIGRARRYKEGFCVCLVEVDGFTAISQGYGQAAGDAVLSQMAAQLMASVRMTDVAARMEGGRFALMVVECGIDEASIVAGRIRQRVARQRFALPKVDGQGIEVSCTVSIGIAAFAETDSLFSLLQRTEWALGAARSAGRDQVRAAQ